RASLAKCFEESRKRHLDEIILRLTEDGAQFLGDADDREAVGADLDLFAERIDLREQPIGDIRADKANILSIGFIEVADEAALRDLDIRQHECVRSHALYSHAI